MIRPSARHGQDSLPNQASVGAKAAALVRLAEAGIPVPAFSVVAAPVLGRHLLDNGIPWPPPPAVLADRRRLAAFRETIRSSPSTDAVGRLVLGGYDRLGPVRSHGRVAVRSCGREEDSRSASFAGQFDSFLNVDRSGLLDAVKDCWASYVSERSVEYRTAQGIPFGAQPRFDVIVQVQVFPQRAGVVFTEHPIEPACDVVYIEANFGTGESVVGGLATPDSVTVSRSDGRITGRVTATKRRMTTVSLQSPGTQLVALEGSQQSSPVLTDRDARDLFEMSIRIEELMGEPQDIEWAQDPDQLWIVQARPITARDATA